MDITRKGPPPLPEPRRRYRRGLLGTVMAIGAVAVVTVGAVVLAVVIWFFAACANNPDCLTFG